MSKKQSGTDRQIRVFVSSTFRDMHAERDYLVKFVFPQLRKLCESRGIVWGEVDLRWGVTDEQVAEGKVLPICLEEIRRCRPYFIGLLGERYGWIPDTIPADVVDSEPWLCEHLNDRKSVTELEILHGVLNNPDMAQHAFFYFRDPTCIDSVPVEQLTDFRSEDADHAAKLARLKEAIRGSGLPVRENYRDPQALGELVRTDLTGVIDSLFPEGSQLDPLDREAQDHAANARSRQRVYIGRMEYFTRLDVHASARDDLPLVVVGESGGGKSALLANWAARWREQHPEACVLEHYIGATPASADWAYMLRRIMGEFRRRLGITQDIPGDRNALRSAFRNWLSMAGAHGHVILVLDALNQLEDRDGAPDLIWLPQRLPENVRLIVSTLPGRPLDNVRNWGWPQLRVEPLTLEERQDLIRQLLRQYGRNLSPAVLTRIATAPQSANPLYLRVLLEELRLFGIHERLSERIEHYLQAESPYELYAKVIARWEADYEGDSDLVGDTLSLLWASRRGLSESELLDALGENARPLPRAAWSPLFLAMSDGLVSRGGLLVFAHDFLRAAARDAYVPTAAHQQQAHVRVADYFQQQPTGPRRTDELAWQLCEAKSWARLATLLSDRPFFAELWQQNQYDVKTYWTAIEASSTFRIVDSNRHLIEHPDAEVDQHHLELMSRLLEQTGHPCEALRLRSALVDRFRTAGDLNALQAALGNQAGILVTRGDLDGALTLLKETERICKQLGGHDGLPAALGNQAVILLMRGDLGSAMTLLLEAEAICRLRGNLVALQGVLGSQGSVLRLQGNLDGAMTILSESERICRQLGHLDGLQRALGEQAVVLQQRGDLNGAMLLHQEEEQICRRLGDLASLSRSLGNQALIHEKQGDLHRAMLLRQEEERICRKLGNLEELQRTLGNQSRILKSQGNLNAALRLLKEQERICGQLGNLDGLQRVLRNQAEIFQMRGDLDAAVTALREDERICRRRRNLDGLQSTLEKQALILHARGDLNGALTLLREQERLCRELGNLDSLSNALGNQAVMLISRGDLQGAMTLLNETEQISRQLGTIEVLAKSLANQASLLTKMGRQRDAVPLVEEALRLATTHGYSVLAQQITPLLDDVRRSTALP